MSPIRLQTSSGSAGCIWSASAGLTKILVETQRSAIGADVRELPSGAFQTVRDGLTFPTLGGALWFAVQAKQGGQS